MSLPTNEKSVVEKQACTDPSEAWIVALESGQQIALPGSRGGRGAKEHLIRNQSPDDFAADVLAMAYKSKDRIVRIALRESLGHFAVGPGGRDPNLNSVRKRIERSLTRDERQSRKLVMSNLQCREIPKGTPITANGGKSTENVILLTYTLTQDQYEALDRIAKQSAESADVVAEGAVEVEA